ncbi:indole-3-glycerol phosphate synthase TrpC [Rothia kristinae]|uniref:Indole-3-glycerol phosphate synthase n=1 Tax=Rothia kristinae TaxID=37923 RepID=A0A147E9F6_9MICC|nr:indole-3-glycerol phosphate synthase TrpC [Rothia kristinae]TDP57205.1 indole-3-glycerol phosphate synthase [Kocuria sp. AG109]KTR37720.1 indole-3-glycerol phosphate synthase [Rothia kristinae]KTR59800.1 indole-3-glycerol phosphate synthase [Rothia kristinae]KTR69030.1 indole-3-glycerol phosphate synthase [Rothia kristinae]KTR73263.1 indole-3-glycerol phosphate synthase [Rothia kristinae]
MTVLDEIIAGVREDLEARRAEISLEELAKKVASVSPTRDALAALRGAGVATVEIIAEVKRASPSKGALAEIPEPARLAHEYEAGGAAAISVLTESRRFQGRLADLDAVRAEVSIPLLRKDFVIDPYMIWEARAHGADLVLLIAAILDDEQLREYLELTHRLGMNAIVEAHTEEEVDRAVATGAKIIGINTRNLKTLETDPAHFATLADRIPEGRLIVAESGVTGPEVVADYAAAGADVVLVGEALVRTEDPREAVSEFRNHGRRARAARLESIEEERA